MKIDLNSSRLPMRRNMRYVMKLEKKAAAVWRIISRRMYTEILASMRQEKLTKSLPKNWSKNVNSLEIDVSSKVGEIVNKYTQGLRWALIGEDAGPEAVQFAKRLGLTDKIETKKGLVYDVYLNTVDSQRAYYNRVLEKEAPQIRNDLLLETQERLSIRTNLYMDEVVSKLRNDVVEAVQKVQDYTNYINKITASRQAHELVSNDSLSGAMKDLAQQQDESTVYASKTRLGHELRSTFKRFESKWNMAARGEMGLSVAAGNHQSMVEIYGAENEDVKFIWLTMEDDRVCDFCMNASFERDGSYTLYNLKDLRPSGWNVGKKRADWELCYPPAHPNSRSTVVYVPKGFKVLKGGSIVPKNS